MSGNNERKFSYDKLSKQALARCGAGVRRLLKMTDEEILTAKRKDEKKILDSIKEKKKADSKSFNKDRQPILRTRLILPHPYFGLVRIRELTKSPLIRAIVDFAGNASDLRGMGIHVRSHIHNIFTIETTRDKLGNLASQLATQRIQLPRMFLPTLRHAVPTAEVDFVHGNGSEGNGVIVGVVDSPFHVEHHGFRNPTATPAGDHNTRVRYMWVQEPDDAAAPGASPEAYYQDNVNHPNSPDFTGLDYGIIYDEDYINAALQSGSIYGNAAGEISKDPTGDTEHGTHVTGIAAGSGHLQNWGAAPQDIGSAPLSDIVHVCKRSLTTTNIQDASWEDDAIDALNFILRIASYEGRSVVINNSYGTNLGPHNGKSPFDQSRNAMLDSFIGRSILYAAGNDNSWEGFRTGTITAGSTESFDMTPVYAAYGYSSHIWLEIWYKGQDLDFKMDCDGDTTDWVTPPNEFADTVDTYDIEVDRDTEPTGMKKIRLFVDSSFDDWTINLRNQGGSQVEYWAWTGIQGWLAALSGNSVDELTMSDTACARSILTVGSCAKQVGGNLEVIADYSGRGPTLDGRIKPEIVAVGGTNADIDAWKDIESADSTTTGGYSGMSGTSMATPVVTGAIALLLENDPNLSQDTIKALLTQTAERTGLDLNPLDPNYNAVHRNAYGYGRLRLLAPHLHTWPLVNVDTWVRTANDDYGVEPYIGGCICHAPEVKVFDSGGVETTTLQWGQDHRVQVRVHNLGDHTALNTLVRLRYTRPGLAPDDWVPCQDAANNAIEQTVDIPPLDSVLLTFDQRWKPESGEVPAVDRDWGDHYCLLVELDHPDDQLVYNDGDSWDLNIKGRNNVALKNFHIQ